MLTPTARLQTYTASDFLYSYKCQYRKHCPEKKSWSHHANRKEGYKGLYRKRWLVGEKKLEPRSHAQASLI